MGEVYGELLGSFSSSDDPNLKLGSKSLGLFPYITLSHTLSLLSNRGCGSGNVMSLSDLILRLSDWNDRRWKNDEALGLIEPSKSESSSTIGSGIGEGVWQSLFVPGRLFRVFRMSASHLLAGTLSSVPNTLPAFSGTISWNLKWSTLSDDSSSYSNWASTKDS